MRLKSIQRRFGLSLGKNKENMKVVFIEVVRGFLKNSYKELGQKEMSIVPIKGDVIQRDGNDWVVILRRFMFDTEEGDYIKVYIEPYKLY